jgi:hypothetical protein
MVIKMTDKLSDKEVSVLLSALYHSVSEDVTLYNEDIDRIGSSDELGEHIELKRSLILKIIRALRET